MRREVFSEGTTSSSETSDQRQGVNRDSHSRETHIHQMTSLRVRYWEMKSAIVGWEVNGEGMNKEVKNRRMAFCALKAALWIQADVTVCCQTA